MCCFTHFTDNFLNKVNVCWFFLRFGATLLYLQSSSPLTRLISRKVDSTVGRWCLKSWQQKPSEVCPTRKTLMGHPGEPAGSCLQHYPPVYNNALTDTGLYRVSLLGVCFQPLFVMCTGNLTFSATHCTNTFVTCTIKLERCREADNINGFERNHGPLLQTLSTIIYFHILHISRILHKLQYEWLNSSFRTTKMRLHIVDGWENLT